MHRKIPLLLRVFRRSSARPRRRVPGQGAGRRRRAVAVGDVAVVEGEAVGVFGRKGVNLGEFRRRGRRGRRTLKKRKKKKLFFLPVPRDRHWIRFPHPVVSCAK